MNYIETHDMVKVMAGTTFTAASGAYSFFGTTLVIVQWFAAFVAVLVGIATLVALVHNWHRKKHK